VSAERVAVIGHGTVGAAMAEWLASRCELSVYDPAKGYNDWDAVADCQVAFVCVPTPERADGACDVSAVEDAVRKLSAREGIIVVIRSTVAPGTTAALQAKHPTLAILFMPEFLSDATAVDDFLHPARHVVGFAGSRDAQVLHRVLSLLPPAGFVLLMKSTEAELVKYFANCWYAVKVSFANQMYDMSQAIGAQYEDIRRAAEVDPMCGPTHLDVFHKGYRGFGGKCLPKDTNAMLVAAASVGVDMSVLRAAKEYNDTLTNAGK